MKKKLIIGCIILSGIILSSIKYNAFNIWSWTSTDLGILLGVSLAVFFGSIIFLNTRKTEPKSSKSTNMESQKIPRLELDDKLKYYLSIGIPSLLLSLYLGFSQKVLTDSNLLYRASKKATKWQRDDYIASKTMHKGFFELSGYRFNYEIFLITMVLLLGTAIIIRNTIYYDKIKNYVNSISRNPDE